MAFIRYILAITVGFFIITFGSIDLAKIVMPLMFGPYPWDGNVPFIRTFTDFIFSFGVAIFGAFVAAWIAPARPLAIGVIASLTYFSLSFYWFTTYGLSAAEWIKPIFFLLKVPAGGYVGGLLYMKLSTRKP